MIAPAAAPALPPAAEPQPLEAYEFKHDPKDFKIYWDVRRGLIPIVGAARKPGTSMLLEDVACPVDKWVLRAGRPAHACCFRVRCCQALSPSRKRAPPCSAGCAMVACRRQKPIRAAVAALRVACGRTGAQLHAANPHSTRSLRLGPCATMRARSAPD